MNLCNECKKDKMLHSPQVPLCEDCYCELFTPEQQRIVDIIPHLGEEDFHISSEIAITTPSSTSIIYGDVSNPQFLDADLYASLRVTSPEPTKRYQVDFLVSITKEEQIDLLYIMASEGFIDSNAPSFQSIKHLLKEVD